MAACLFAGLLDVWHLPMLLRLWLEMVWWICTAAGCARHCASACLKAPGWLLGRVKPGQKHRCQHEECVLHCRGCARPWHAVHLGVGCVPPLVLRLHVVLELQARGDFPEMRNASMRHMWRTHHEQSLAPDIHDDVPDLQCGWGLGPHPSREDPLGLQLDLLWGGCPGLGLGSLLGRLCRLEVGGCGVGSFEGLDGLGIRSDLLGRLCSWVLPRMYGCKQPYINGCDALASTPRAVLCSRVHMQAVPVEQRRCGLQLVLHLDWALGGTGRNSR